MSIVELYFDGGARPNPGHAGCGIHIPCCMNKEYKISKYLGDSVTNNQAEYNGLLHGLLFLSSLGIKRVKVIGDSLLVISQMTGKWKCNIPQLQELRLKCLDVSKQFEHIEYTHVLREHNKVADELSTLAIINKCDL